jgi:hypothetical protein
MIIVIYQMMKMIIIHRPNKNVNIMNKSRLRVDFSSVIEFDLNEIDFFV